MFSICSEGCTQSCAISMPIWLIKTKVSPPSSIVDPIRFWLSCLDSFGFLFLNKFAFKYFVVCLWEYQMNVIPLVFESTRWMLFLLSLRLPDECYSCCPWEYQMNVIPVVFESTWWMLFLLSLRVPDECYSCCLWEYQMNVIPVVFESTRWMLFMLSLSVTRWMLFLLSLSVTRWMLFLLSLSVTRWMLFRKLVMRTKFDICIFILNLMYMVW